MKSETAVDVGLATLLLFIFCLRIWNIGLVSHDDAMWALGTFQDVKDVTGAWARSQGRLYAFPYGAMMLHALRWLGTSYGELLRVGSFAIFFATFHVFVAVYCGRRLALLSCSLFFAFFTLRWEASILTSGPLAPWVFGTAAMITMLLVHAYARRGHTLLLIASTACMFVSLFTNEATAVCHCVLFLFAVIWNSFETIAAHQSIRATHFEYFRVRQFKPMITSLAVAVASYATLSIGWRLLFPSQYEGHVLATFDLTQILTVTFQFATGNSVLRHFFQPYAVNFSDSLVGGLTHATYKPSTFIRTLAWYPAAIMFGFVVAWQFSRAMMARAGATPVGLRFLAPEIFAILVGLSLAIFPMLPPAATARYQGWYLQYGVSSFSTSIFAYFGLSLIIAGLISITVNIIGHWRLALAFASTLVVGLVAATSYRMNDEIAFDIRAESARWRIVQLALESISKAQMDVAAIWAPRFQSGSWFTVLPMSYWSDYAKARYNSDIKFLDALPPADKLKGAAYLDYFPAHDDTSFIGVLAQLQPPNADGAARAWADMIAVHLERPTATTLRRLHLSFVDDRGVVRQIALGTLQPKDSRGQTWVLNSIRAAPESIRITRQTFLERELRPCATTLMIPQKLTFGANQASGDGECQGTAFLRSGWGPVETDGVWSVNKQADISIATRSLPGTDLALSFDLSTYPAPGGQTVRAFLNDHLIATWVFDRRHPVPETRFNTAPDVIGPNGMLNLMLEVEPIVNPKKLGISEDTRDFGVLLRSVRIEPVR